jgi:signal transduction histidine kinase
MPDTIRTSWRWLRRRRRKIGQSAGTIGAIAVSSAGAAEQPAMIPHELVPHELGLHELVLNAHRGIAQHEIIVLTLITGVAVFAVVSAIMLVRARHRAAQLQAAAQTETAILRASIDRARALRLSEPQLVVDWPAGSDEPAIEGDPAIIGLSETQQLLAFDDWLESGKAAAMSRAVEALRARGEPFVMTLSTLDGRPLEVQGRAMGGHAVLRLKEAGGVKRELVDLLERYEKLSAEAAALRAVVEKLPSPVWTRNAAGRLTFVNPAYARAVEAQSATEAIDRRLELLDSAARESIVQARLARGAYSVRLRAAIGGGQRTLDVIDFDTEAGSAGIVVDATEAESMRSALARLADAHRRTLDQLSTGVAMFDASQRLTFYNEAYRTLWDLDAALLDQRPSDSAVLDMLRAARKLPEERDFRLWKSQLHEAYRTAEPRDHTWHLPDGRTLRVITTPNSEGGLTYLFHDVSERLDLERRFEELIRIQGETLDKLAEGVAVFGSDGRLRLHNAAFERMWRLPPDLFADRPHIEKISTLCQPLHGDAPAWRALRQAVTAIESREATLGRIERRDGSVIDCTTVPLPDGATLATFHDVSDSVNVERALRERNEALEDADKIKVDFVHHVSYELRSPLTNIIGFVHLLCEPATGPLIEKQREYLEYITVSTNTLLALINNILDLATIDAGRMHLDLASVDIREAMSAAAEGVQDRMVSGGVTLDMKAPANIGSFVADKLRLRQILFNLLANALSFSPPGSTVTLRAERRPDAIVFSVTDMGPGIPADMLKKVFDWFETHSLGSQHRGPGIGLSLVRSFVELHGGEVTIDSAVGQGTTVACIFPLADTASLTAAE